MRQLRLRDIGGIIVIDFIDMANPKNRQAVEDAFRTELERDRTKTYVVEISPLGLVEMTRQNVTDGPREVMTRACPTCGGDGIVVSDATSALQVERKLRALAVAGAGSRVQAYRVAVHPRTLALLAGPGGSRLGALEDATRRRFYLVPAEGHAHHDHFEVLAEGRRADLAPAAPVEEGAEAELKLLEVDLHDLGAAVGKVDGLDVVVADTAKLVGKKVKVVVGRVLDGHAFATLVDTTTIPTPITFESEAEKPTRAPARRKTGEEAARRRSVAESRRRGRDRGRADGRRHGGGSRRGRGRGRRRGLAGEEAHAARLTGWQAAQEVRGPRRRGDAGGGRRRRAPRGRGRGPGAGDGRRRARGGRAACAKPKTSSRRRRTPKIHVPDTDGNGAEPPEAVPAAGPPAEAVAAVEEAPIEVAETDGEAPPRRSAPGAARGAAGTGSGSRRPPTAT